MPKLKPRPVAHQDEGDTDSVVQTVFGDLVTFIMMLFILLFVLSYNENKSQDFITEFQVKFGDEVQEQQVSLTTDALLVSKVEHYIQKEDLSEYAHIIVDENRVRVILNPPVLFDSGKADIKQKGKRILAGVADIFDNVVNPIVIEGHTDNVPINNDEFESNWELSFYRAFSVIKYLIYGRKYKPTRVSALGYGEFKPLVANDSAKNRALNRRIEMHVIRLTEAQ